MPMQQASITTDFLVIGDDVIGMNISWALKKHYPISGEILNVKIVQFLGIRSTS